MDIAWNAANVLATELAMTLERLRLQEEINRQHEAYEMQLLDGNEWLRRQNTQLVAKLKELRRHTLHKASTSIDTD